MRSLFIRGLSAFVVGSWLLVLIPATAHADTFNVSFVMVNPRTNQPVEAGGGYFIVQSVDQSNGTRKTYKSGDSGVTTLTLDRIYMYMVSPSINGPGGYFPADFLMIKPLSDGSVKVLSSTGNPVLQDSASNWVIGFPPARATIANDPWKIITNNFPNGVSMLELLPNGKILATANDNSGLVTWWLLSPDLNGDYTHGKWSKASSPPPSYNPGNFNSTILHSGNLLVIGSEANYDATTSSTSPTNDVYIYNVAKDAWEKQSSPQQSSLPKPFLLSANPTVGLPNGKVLVTANQPMIPSMLFDEKTSTWTTSGNCCSNSESAFTLMQNDKVLHIDTEWNTPSLTQVYDPSNGQWSNSGSTLSPISVSEIGPAISLMDGRVFATGSTEYTALYDPLKSSWSNGPTFPRLANGWIIGGADGQVAVLPSGNVLISGGGFDFLQNPKFMSYMPPVKYFLFNPKDNSLTPVIDDPFAPGTTTWAPDVKLLVLPSGQILVSHWGRLAIFSDGLGPEDQWRPVIESISDKNIVAGISFSLQGKQLSGLTQGTQFGDELENPTNFPLIKVINDKTGHVFYGTTSNYSSTSIAPMAPSSFDFNFGLEVENGPSKIITIANGIESVPVEVSITGGTELPKPIISPTPIPSPSTTPESSKSSSVVVKTQTKIISTKTTSIKITCVKGNLQKQVSGLKPKCPKGFLRK